MTVARAAAFCVLGMCGLLTACGPKASEGPAIGTSHKATPPPESALPQRGPARFAFDSLDDRPVTSQAMAGKPSVLAFVTTGSIDAQAQLGYLVAMAKHDGTKVNYAVVALHPRREIPLVDALVTTVKVDFPVALADPQELSGEDSPFGPIAVVPTTVVLDPSGTIVWMKTGLAKSDEIRAHMRGH